MGTPHFSLQSLTLPVWLGARDAHSINFPRFPSIFFSNFVYLKAKFDEIENRIPTIEQLNFFVHNSFERSEFHAMELLLLDHFSWNVDLPTAASFVDMFLVHSVLDDDSHSGRPLNNCTKARVYVKKYVHYFLEISLQGTPPTPRKFGVNQDWFLER